MVVSEATVPEEGLGVWTRSLFITRVAPLYFYLLQGIPTSCSWDTSFFKGKDTVSLPLYVFIHTIYYNVGEIMSATLLSLKYGYKTTWSVNILTMNAFDNAPAESEQRKAVKSRAMYIFHIFNLFTQIQNPINASADLKTPDSHSIAED